MGWWRVVGSAGLVVFSPLVEGASVGSHLSEAVLPLSWLRWGRR